MNSQYHSTPFYLDHPRADLYHPTYPLNSRRITHLRTALRIPDSTLVTKVKHRHPNAYGKKSQGYIAWESIPVEPTPIRVLIAMGISKKDIWWMWHRGHLAFDGKRWEDTEYCTHTEIVKWKRKDLFHRLYHCPLIDSSELESPVELEEQVRRNS